MTNPIKTQIVTDKDAQEAIRTLLMYIGEDPQREGLQDTPKRFIKAFNEYCKGYHDDPEEYLKTHFEDILGYDEAVVLKDIPFYSHCEHHMAPIHGTATVAYIPNKRIVGISKLARVVESFARRLQIQEKLTGQIAQCIQNSLKPKGVAVYIKATHHCMMGRGVNIQGANLITQHFTGIYKTDESLRQDFQCMMRTS